EAGSPAADDAAVAVERGRGTGWRYTAPRLFGAMLWCLGPHNHELWVRLGQEPLTDRFDGERLYGRSRGKSSAVKPFVMDNAVVVGVGNIYATEARFAGGLDPRREAGSGSRARYPKLATALQRILAFAIGRGGTPLRGYLGGDSTPGYCQQDVLAYG
ncbi:DNA-formamidopyrimidine glycosylase, partial [Pseudomonas syringae]